MDCIKQKIIVFKLCEELVDCLRVEVL